MTDLTDTYKKLQGKYTLPSFADLDRSFDISGIDISSNILREIRKKIESRLDDIGGMLGSIIQPDANIRDLHEGRMFSEREKAKIFSLYRKFMIIRREVALLSIDTDEKKEAVFIQGAFSEWSIAKEELLSIGTKLRDSWKKETSVREELGYLG